MSGVGGFFEFFDQSDEPDLLVAFKFIVKGSYFLFGHVNDVRAALL